MKGLSAWQSKHMVGGVRSMTEQIREGRSTIDSEITRGHESMTQELVNIQDEMSHKHWTQ